MRYKTARALEQAAKAAVRRSGRDVNRAINDFYHDRLLERIFSEEEPSFVLKGGRGMLARTASARYTRDTDMAYEGGDLGKAVSELRRLAAIDLVDLVIYLTTEDLDGDELAHCLDRERRMGHMDERRPFSVPEGWKGLHATTYERLARESKLDPAFLDVSHAETLVAGCVNAALLGESRGMTWSHATVCWEISE